MVQGRPERKKKEKNKKHGKNIKTIVPISEMYRRLTPKLSWNYLSTVSEVYRDYLRNVLELSQESPGAVSEGHNVIFSSRGLYIGPE